MQMLMHALILTLYLVNLCSSAKLCSYVDILLLAIQARRHTRGTTVCFSPPSVVVLPLPLEHSCNEVCFLGVVVGREKVGCKVPVWDGCVDVV